MRIDKDTGVLVVGHGSRRREANDDVREATRRIAELGNFPLIEAAFLEIESPNIAEGFRRLVDRGARKIIVHPYFLSPGRHTRGDIPVEVREVASKYQGISFRISEPLAAHPAVISASVERIRESILENVSTPFGFAAQPGTVYLVGAGPGDPGLLTVKARDLLASCDVIVYDYLVNPDILDFARSGSERVYAGKVGGGHHTPQDEINSQLIAYALKGKRVVRLKGGDPFLFGRGAEEAEALHEAGISFEIVPGVSSALAAPAYAGIPLTHRDYSSSVTITTGTRAIDGRLRSPSSTSDTIVILMGVKNLGDIARDLIESGRSTETPVAVVRWGSYDGQQTVVGTLATIAELAERQSLRAPAVIVVGEVVKLRERLKWFEETVKSSRWQEELEGATA